MARMRSLKPEFWDDRKLARSTSRDARMLYMGLWNHADEHSRCNGDTLWLKGRIWPYDDDIDAGYVDKLLAELAAAGRIHRYEVDSDPYLFLPKLDKHQRLEPKVESRLPAPPPADTPEPPPEPDRSAPHADSSVPDADSSGESVAKHVAGSREHVAGSSKNTTRASRADSLERFEAEFWPECPLKVAKEAARRAWLSALRRGADPQHVVAAMKRYAIATRGTEARFIKHPATWLNAGCYDDQPAPATPLPAYWQETTHAG